MNNVFEKLDAHTQRYKAEEWEGTFREYLSIVRANPRVAQLAHARIYEMVRSHGVETDAATGAEKYLFFRNDLFGIDEALAQIMEYFKAASLGSDVGRRILMIYGPPSSGKSQFVILLKRGLEEYTRTPEGAIYAIADCPMHEEPLHLVPHSLRPDFLAEYKLHIEGELCPLCALNLREKYKNDIYAVPVKRIFFSERERLGIGTFVPADPKCVVGESMLLNGRGLQTFEEIYLTLPEKPRADQFVTHQERVIGIHGPTDATQFYFGGVQDTYEVKTQLGYTLQGTRNHPLLSLNSEGQFVWKKIGDLRVGDYVALARGTNVFGDSTELPDTFYPLPKQPTQLDPDLAFWLGLLIAEGNIGEWEVWITNGSRALVERWCAITQDKFGLEAHPYRKAEEYAWSVNVSSHPLSIWLRSELGLARGAENKSIPPVVLQSTRENVLAFLEGLFWGDGTLRSTTQNSNIFKYASASRTLARQVHMLLLNLGLEGARQVEEIEGKPYYSVVLRGDRVLQLVDLIPSLRDKATRALRDEMTYNTNYDHLPPVPNLLTFVQGDPYIARVKRGERSLTYTKAREILANAPNDPRAARLQELVDRHYLWLPVESITPTGRQPVYDVLVPESHSFVADGFVQHNSQDITELVGSIDLSTIGEYGAESDPRAYRFDGELNVANRGLMEFIEMLKADERFLYVLLTLSQEKNIKTGRFPLIYADEVVVAHTNESEFNAFMADKKSEALQDRMIVVRMPYNLKVSAEQKIYEKLLRQSSLGNIHIAPHTLAVASMFAVLSRLEEPKIKGLTLVKKMKLYDGAENVEGFRQKDLKQIREQTEREGMDGISPRFIINRISAAFTKPSITCVNPIDALRAIKDGIETHSGLTKEHRDRYVNLIADARKEYDEIAKTDVQKAFFVSFEKEAHALLDNYLDNVEAYLDDAKLTDPITGEEVPPNEKLMRSIEEKVKVSESGKDAFRNEIFRKVAMAERRGEKFDYRTHDKLREAIERQLFDERRDTIKLTVSARNPDPEQLRKINEVVDTLIKREGYCTVCANELLKYVSSLLAREK